MTTPSTVSDPSPAWPPDDAARGQASRPRVALVCMPWGAVTRGSIALGILKRCLNDRGYTVDVHYLNIHFAETLGVDLYNRILQASAFFPEWFFSVPLFGKHGLGLIDNNWDDLAKDDVGQRLKHQLAEMVDGWHTTCQAISEDVIPLFIERCLTTIDWSQYAIVGFSTSFAQTMASLLLAKAIHDRHPGVAIVFGGANTEDEMGLEILKGFDWVDYVVHGEAETSFPRLVDAIASGTRPEPMPGVSMRQGRTLVCGYASAQPLGDLNQSPLPDYSDYFREIERAGLHKSLPITLFFESSRGCWWGAKHHCTFCGLNGTTMAFRKKTPDRVYRDIIELAGTYRCLNLQAVDNILALDYFQHLLPKLIAAEIDLTLFYEVKANLSREQMRTLRDAGVVQIQPGIESLSTRLLHLMRKGVTAIQNIQLLKWCHEFGIDPSWNVLYGFPGEQPGDYDDYPHYFRLLSHLRAPGGVVPVMFERFSPYHFDREGYGLTIQPLPYYRLIFPEALVDLEKIAYYFTGVWKDCAADPGDYSGALREAAHEWQKHWEQRDTFCSYEKGPGFLSIYDNRPLAPARSIAARKTILNDLQARAYLYCDESRSFKAIHGMLSTTVRPGLTPEQTRVMLEQFVKAGLMFREGERYLALATHKAAPAMPGSARDASTAA